MMQESLQELERDNAVLKEKSSLLESENVLISMPIAHTHTQTERERGRDMAMCVMLVRRVS